jgi:hypothetical protein
MAESFKATRPTCRCNNEPTTIDDTALDLFPTVVYDTLNKTLLLLLLTIAALYGVHLWQHGPAVMQSASYYSSLLDT